MDRLLLFCYGSNMLRKRLAFRVYHLGPVNAVGTYTLQNYRLVFNAGAKFANVVPSIGNRVEGVLYEMNNKQMRELDWYEGFYERQYKIINFNGKQEIMCLYVCTNPKFLMLGCPTLDYLNLCLDGAKENGLKDTYNDLLDIKIHNLGVKRSRHKPM